MTTSVLVRARAWGALATVRKATEGDEGHNIESTDYEIGAHEDREFHLSEGETLEVRQGNAPEPVNEIMTSQTVEEDDVLELTEEDED